MADQPISTAIDVACDVVPAVIDDPNISITDDLVTSRARSYLVARYTHGDGPPNRNGHLFRTKDLRRQHRLVPNSPLNMMHRRRDVVGTFVRSQFVPGPSTDIGDYTETSMIRTLMALWHFQFPEEANAVRSAYDRNALWVSQESVPETVTCPVCDHTAPWAGYVNDGNCDHMNQPRAPRWMNNPEFLGGGLVIPPWQPGWRDAYVESFDAAGRVVPDTVEALFAALKARDTDLTEHDIEAVAGQILMRAGHIPVDTSPLIAPLWRKIVGPYETIDFTPPVSLRLNATRLVPELAGVEAPTGWYADDVTQDTIDHAIAVYRGRRVTPRTALEVSDVLSSNRLPDRAAGDPVRTWDLLGGVVGLQWYMSLKAQMGRIDQAIDAMVTPALADDDDAPDQKLAAARDGEAMPDGTFHLRTHEDLRIAIHALPRTPADRRAAAKEHIITRARVLKAPTEIIELLEQLPDA